MEEYNDLLENKIYKIQAEAYKGLELLTKEPDPLKREEYAQELSKLISGIVTVFHEYILDSNEVIKAKPNPNALPSDLIK